MKNKSKLNKIKQGKQNGYRVPKEWLYLNQKQISVREIAEVFSLTWESQAQESQTQGTRTQESMEREASGAGMKAQLWEEAGVVEIELPEAKSMDFEWTDIDLGDEYSNDYLAKHQIQSVFLVTVVPEDFPKAEQAMKRIISELGGFFCGDTEDFSPVVKS